MPMFIVRQARLVTSEWYNIEAKGGKEAIEQVMMKAPDPDETYDEMQGDFEAESQDEKIVALARAGKYYCLPCMKDKVVLAGDQPLTQQDVDMWKLHPGWQVLCSGCDKVLSSPDKKED